MKKLITSLALGAAMLTLAVPASAQDNVLEGKTINPLGEAKTWTSEEGTEYTFITADLEKLIDNPTNTSNVFLFPETGGEWVTPANQEIGIQGFYIDLGQTTEIGVVTTTWEGAAANAYCIYLTDTEPTPAILDTTPTYSAEKLGQYTSNTAVLPEGSKGRYLTFQATDATNWGWGVKIRSISATEPADDVLTTFKVAPSILAGREQTPVTLTLLNQHGLAIPQNDVSVTVSDNAVYANGNLTILSGNSATFTATLGETLTATVYVADAPDAPAASTIKTPIYTNTLTDENGTAEFTVNYNGGAVKGGELVFDNGEVAQLFLDTRCVFFNNTATTGGWNANLNPAENGWRNLCLDVFSGVDTQCSIEFESVENLEGGHTIYFDLKGGQWNPISVNVAGATKLGNLSIRFTEANMADILLTNIYFTPTYVEGDEEAPVLGEIEAEAGKTTIELTLTATDDLSTEIYYTITDGVNTWSTTGTSGESVNYTITGLDPSTEYNLTVTASDGKNISEPKSIQVTTTGMPDAPTPTIPETNVIAIYSNAYGKAELPTFDSWGSAGRMEVTTTENGNQVLLFINYQGQWGGLVNIDSDIDGANTLNIDIYSEETGSLTIAPVWQDANGATTPNKKLDITEADAWNTFAIELSEFGYDNYGTTVIQIALTDSTLPSFAVDNLFFSGDHSLAVNETLESESEALVNVYNMQGICLKRGVKADEAIRTLPAGLYIIGGKKIAIHCK